MLLTGREGDTAASRQREVRYCLIAQGRNILSLIGHANRILLLTGWGKMLLLIGWGIYCR